MDSKKQDRHREIQYVQYQQCSIHTCIVCSISNEQFTGLLPDTTQSFKFMQHNIFFILPLALLPLKLPIHTPNFSHKEELSRDIVCM